MKNLIWFISFLLLLASCVPVAKYRSSQNEILDLQGKNARIKSFADSLRENYMVLKSDFNNLSYEMYETERYAQFTDKELLAELNRQKTELKRNSDMLHQLQAAAEHSGKMGVLRAQSFSAEASCILGQYSTQKFILLKQNVITLDIEGLMNGARDRQADFKNSLKDLLYSFRNREDVLVSISLYQSGTNSSWNKVSLQQELLNYLVAEAAMPEARVAAVTKIITKEKSPEFGLSADSRLLLEVEFKG